MAAILPIIVFAVGAAALGIEIAAVRLLAPYFGASTIVWANTIGVVLVALSLGYWWGGRLADAKPRVDAMCRVILVAGLATAAVPFIARPLLDVGVDALDAISAGAFVGSMIATLALIAAPVLLLGTVAPWALRIGMQSVERSGELAGQLYAMSTLGSLIGTLFSALLLIPAVGTRLTFLIFALMLVLTALLGLRPVLRYAAAPALVAALMLVPAGSIKPSDGPNAVLFEADTEYQYARVVEPPGGERRLELNEGQAIHSVYDSATGSAITNNYWDGHVFWSFAAQSTPPRRVAILGNAAGTVARAYAKFFPRTYVDGVEIDAELSEIGRRFFDMRGPRLELFHTDARPYLRSTDRRYDVISLDTYRQPYIPFYLTTREFFALARDRLAPGGVVIVNVGHPRGQNELERVLTATIGTAFAHVMRDPVRPTNTLLLASDRPIAADSLRRATREFAPELRDVALPAADRLAAPLTGGEVYSDDRAPVEWLIDESIVRYAAGDD